MSQCSQKAVRGGALKMPEADYHIKVQFQKEPHVKIAYTILSFSQSNRHSRYCNAKLPCTVHLFFFLKVLLTITMLLTYKKSDIRKT